MSTRELHRRNPVDSGTPDGAEMPPDSGVADTDKEWAMFQRKFPGEMKLPAARPARTAVARHRFPRRLRRIDDAIRRAGLPHISKDEYENDWKSQ